MKFVIVTHVPHMVDKDKYFAYAPYVREMNIWEKYVEELIIVAPLIQALNSEIESTYSHNKITFLKIENINLLGFKSICNTILRIPKISLQIFKGMKAADHIHLRCPGNIGLLGCFIQIFFPYKIKTAKYAGNWDPKAKQPWSYNLQKWILRNTFLTRNMQVLIYGEWEGSTSNIKPFFTASYFENEKLPIKELDMKRIINFVFVGTLSAGKDPLYAIQIVECLYKKGYKVSLDLYGEGVERLTLESYIATNNLKEYIILKGNQNLKAITNIYQNSHFVILPSKSEGWPKALAEGMFWGCVPVATMVSCVPFMLDYGKRGIFLHKELELDIKLLENLLNTEPDFNSLRKKVSDWSRKYTLDVFESEIKKIVKK